MVQYRKPPVRSQDIIDVRGMSDEEAEAALRISQRILEVQLRKNRAQKIRTIVRSGTTKVIRRP